MKIGLFFGSFNPVHVGHLIIANYMANMTDLDHVRMVVSPHNPLKERKILANDNDRLQVVKLAIGDNTQISASDIEFNLSKPSYTIDTLSHLKEIEPDHEFTLIMGGDNLSTLHKWKNYKSLLDNYRIFVYNRSKRKDEKYADHQNVHMYKAPLLQISSSYIRRLIAEGKSVLYLVPEPAFEYIDRTNMYRPAIRKDN